MFSTQKICYDVVNVVISDLSFSTSILKNSVKKKTSSIQETVYAIILT